MQAQGNEVNSTIHSYAVLEFQALRQEILGIKERVIRLQVLGVAGIPLIIGAADKYDLALLLAASPLIALSWSLMLIFEQNSLMRAGTYIKRQLEPLLGQNTIGWETWLESDKRHRRAEAFFAWSAHIAFSVYYIGGSYLAVQGLANQYGSVVSNAAVGLYAGGFLLAVYVVIANFTIHTGDG